MGWADRVRRLRGSLTQKDFAEIGQSTTATIRAIESGTRIPSVVTLENLVKARGMTLAEFVGTKVLERFADPIHQELHEKLQFILENNSRRAQGITININDIYNCALRDAQPPESLAGGEPEHPGGLIPRPKRIRTKKAG